MANSALTAQIINREALRLLYLELTKEDPPKYEPGTNMWSITLLVDDRELLLGLDDFSARLLRPPMKKLAEEILLGMKKAPGRGYAPAPLKIGPIMGALALASVDTYNGICLRICREYSLDSTGKVYRFDVVILRPITERLLTIEERLTRVEKAVKEFHAEWKSAHGQEER